MDMATRITVDTNNQPAGPARLLTALTQQRAHGPAGVVADR